MFTYIGIDFFPCASITSLTEILNKNYDFYILDMGVINTYVAIELAKCDKQFLVCSLSKWKRHQTEDKINELFQQTHLSQERVTILANLQTKKSISFPGFKYRISIPFISNPFQLEPDLFRVFHHMLGRKN